MCSFEDLLRILGVGLPTLTDEQLRDALADNLAYAYHSVPNRPSVSGARPIPLDSLRNEDFVSVIEKDMRYGTLITERVEAVSLKEWILRHADEYRVMDFQVVLFQITYALWTMELRKLLHWDLHVGNILVQKTRARRVSYLIENTNVSFDALYTAYIFDFDQAFVETLGPNMWHRANEAYFVPNLDLARFLCELFDTLDRCTHANKEHFITLVEDTFGVQRARFKISDCYVAKPSLLPGHIGSDYLLKLSKRMVISTGRSDQYACSVDMFRPDGGLRTVDEVRFLREARAGNNQEPIENVQQSLDDVRKLVAGMQGDVKALRREGSKKPPTSLVTTASAIASALSVVMQGYQFIKSNK
jgi:hypothetical protein